MVSSSSHEDGCQCEHCVDEEFLDHHMNFCALSSINTLTFCHHYATNYLKTPMRDSSMEGHRWIWELWHGHDGRFFENMRMRKVVLQQLIASCVNHGSLNPKPRQVSLEESFAIFLLIVGQGLTYPAVAERLQRSTETISNHFHCVLKAVCKLDNKIIRPVDPSFQNTDPILALNLKYHPAFENCVGAIDDTHITLHVSEGDKIPWYNRKGVTTMNVLAICDVNMCIIFSNIGCEGSMHDARVLRDSMTNPKRKFPYPPDGKYFLANAGYPLMNGFLTPYKQTRYHLPEFRANRIFKNKNEMFNYRHSSLRSVIERTFGVLMKRWRILNTMAMVDLPTQIRVIWACMALHNFIRRYDADDLQLVVPRWSKYVMQ